MSQLKDGRALCTFSVSASTHAVVLLLLAHCCQGQPRVIGAPRPIAALLGEDIILPCHLEPATDAASTAVEWTRPDLKPRFVHVWRSGQHLLDDQHPSYRGRTSVFVDKLKHGNISLKLSEVKMSDEGTYRCYIPIFNRDSTVELVFGSVSSPNITMTKVGNRLLLVCKSKGRYIKPEVLWLDGEGNLLPAGPPETVRGPDDLYTVSSRVTVEKRHSNRFTCRVQQKNINQTREAHFQISADLFVVQCSSAVRISICLIVCLTCIALVVLVLWKWGGNIKSKMDPKMRITTLSTAGELQLLMEGNRDMTEDEKIAYFDETKAKLDEKLEKNKEELNLLEEIFKTVKKQKEDLKKQREKLTSLLQDDKVQIEENRKKLKEKPKTGKDRRMQKREETKENLETRQEEHEELIKNTEELLETTEGLIIKMTERKVKLESEREQIEKYLKETVRQREVELKKSERRDSQSEPEAEELWSM